MDVLRDVSLEAPAGKLTAVVGPAGSGKTSLLHLLAGLDRPAGGTVTLDGRPLRGLDDLELTRLRRDRIGLLLPAASVLPTITVRENIALPLLIARRAPEPEAIDALLERVGLADRHDERPGQLTAAERQRAALARALVGGPSVLLADEPAGELEPEEGAHLLDAAARGRPRGRHRRGALHARHRRRRRRGGPRSSSSTAGASSPAAAPLAA